MFFKALSVIVVTFSFSWTAQAENSGGLFVEPGITYQVNSAELKYPVPGTNSTADANAFGLMARLGFHVSEAFFAGVDARYSFHDLKDSTNNFNTDAQSYNLAPVVGVQMPDLGLRVWGAYILAGEMDPKAANGFDVRFSEPQGFRLGAGFRVVSFSLNLEYERLDYRIAELESVGSFGAGATSSSFDMNTDSWIASISFPVEL